MEGVRCRVIEFGSIFVHSNLTRPELNLVRAGDHFTGPNSFELVAGATRGPSWGHPMVALGTIRSLLEPFCGHLSPKIDKVSEELTLSYPHEGPRVVPPAAAREHGQRARRAPVPVELHGEEEEQAEPRLEDAVHQHREEPALLRGLDHVPREGRDPALDGRRREREAGRPEEAQEREERAGRPHAAEGRAAAAQRQPHRAPHPYQHQAYRGQN